ncbi:fibronectin type III domain-containing protein [Colletotrichum orchidophilum]|uniref:Fibronectin type III domain-containing protein n=1 Tax=Colletotrichum orchidophilum TaxID=1209926 RepID=A0A1G4AUH1_9PEZI|nr:fibronectin type III domain-containing protein [Colletotrichum orchidophilum]OHE92820.1 fibronectin type III domain-containing protein [Colletotrichum orchidophilum]
MDDMIQGTNRPVRIMIVGDSMSHGHEGDFTWRYRLWQWLKHESIDFEFVGPYRGTKTPDQPHPPQPPALEDDLPTGADVAIDRGGYAAGVHFNSHHFSAWGRQATQCKDLIKDQVAQFRPDYLLVMLGFNDMGWGVADAENTLGAMRELVNNARTAKSDIKFAIADVPMRTPMDGAETLPPMVEKYSQLLQISIENWTTVESPAKLVEIRHGYDCSHGSYDGLHPNALGEYQIARAFSQTLFRQFRSGRKELSIPQEVPQRPTPVPANVVAEAVPYGISVTWDPTYGALGYDVRSQKNESLSWNEARVDVAQYDSTWTREGDEYQYQIRSCNGESLKSAWSTTVSAIAHPKTAPGPRNITTKPETDKIIVMWEEPPEKVQVDRYEIILVDLSLPGSFPASTGVRGTVAIFNDLPGGHRYGLAISTWTKYGGGVPAGGRSFIAGCGKPQVPTQLRIEAQEINTVQLKWKRSESAAGYRVWVRDRAENPGFTEDGETDSTEYSITFLYPGAWNFEFCVSAYNGSLESERSGCVVLPRSDVDSRRGVLALS